jgi:hypothetical protein
MPPTAASLNHYATLSRLIDGWPPLNQDSLRAATSLTNLILAGSYPSTTPRPSPGTRASLFAAVSERDAHRAAVAESYGALQVSLSALLRWHGELQDAASSLQGALDAAAARQGGAGSSEPPPALLVAERARDLLAELCADFAAEAALRSALARALLPRSCVGAWARLRRGATVESGGDGGGEDDDGTDACLVGDPGLCRNGENDREALTVALSAWAVPVHATAPRCARLLEALHLLAAPR